LNTHSTKQMTTRNSRADQNDIQTQRANGVVLNAGKRYSRFPYLRETNLKEFADR
jgi:hypothetical protein